MSLSTRLHIRFPPSPASETTDTLVLTFRSQHYLDLRVLRTSPGLSPPIDWAFAGTLTHPGPHRTVWEHRIDSRGFAGVDAGVSTALENGDTLEEGEMVNPASGKTGRYEEVWRTIPVESGAVAYCLESEDDDPDKVKIFVGRIGLYFVSMGEQDGQHFSARRFQLEGGKWRKVYHIGTMDLPSPDEVSEESLQEGATVQIGGRRYCVREYYTT
ncbi:hypothetical protein OE88DRAFT_1312232 [Heliocybe sulcata]|uniref:Protein HRI1 n=1 Tax=Heliocybe sulcata TaxID=5364 RepID=A0A5C3N754_9AGAM|nr:hypothetical protein OE88DRAFT_1312232 [Heliocybe sulcata]